MSLLIKNIHQLIQVANSNQVLKGAAMQALPLLENAFVYCENGIIKAYGKMIDCDEKFFNAAETIDAKGVQRNDKEW